MTIHTANFLSGNRKPTSSRPQWTSLLSTAWQKNNSLLCVGLDPDPSRLPPHLRQHPRAIYEFLRQIVDATADLVCAFKPQIACFSAERAEDQLEQIIAYIHTEYPSIPVILDAKRGDIGSTAAFYAKEAFVRYQADAVTVSPFLGEDAILPYLEWQDRGVIILCRTSNAGAGIIQDLRMETGIPLYQHIAIQVNKWNKQGNCALVVGATVPAQLSEIRKICGDMPLLVPGIGAQGGDVAATLSAGQTQLGNGLIINSSRAILYAGSGEDFASSARLVAMQTRDEINLHRIK